MNDYLCGIFDYRMRITTTENNNEVIVYSFTLKELYDEVEKITSYTGKMVSGDKPSDILERLSLTKSEDFFFMPWLEDAAADTFDWVSGFSKELDNGYTAGTDGVSFKQQIEPWFDKNKVNNVERALLNSIVYYIIYRWYEIVYPEAVEVAMAHAEEYGRKAQVAMNSQNRPIRVHDDLFGWHTER